MKQQDIFWRNLKELGSLQEAMTFQADRERQICFDPGPLWIYSRLGWDAGSWSRIRDPDPLHPGGTLCVQGTGARREELEEEPEESSPLTRASIYYR